MNKNIFKMSSSDESDQNYSAEEQDEERTEIRSQLSTLSFEELQKLKEKIGAKVYKEALFGKKKESDAPKIFKRENKNRPREMSSKKPVRMLQAIPTVKKKEIRDPRFDPLCGEFDKKQFAEDYNFLSDIRIKDIKAIRAELKETTDPERQMKLRRLLQRLNDQHKHTKRTEQRVEALVKQYEELKKEGSGRIQRHLKRRQQKVKKRSFKAPTGVS
ncbi:hypothetical protein HF086_000986 [Spodoptera exigua]|uniref:rRNA biogenesis protein RRP36 n=1 Tax=Spodoptera exigua TaxID=7107 RepID=A0A922M6C9_SPOEX|nr:hypothetical protein HF086_000986 [Spodoptera exigua]